MNKTPVAKKLPIENRNPKPTTCNICLDNYNVEKRPLILVCGHTFCEPCLQNLFDEGQEIQCCFCKVITKLDKFDDMIVNYAVLSLAEFESDNRVSKEKSMSRLNEFNGLNESSIVVNVNECAKDHNVPDKVDKLLQCLDCQKVVCPQCVKAPGRSLELSGELALDHQSHKLVNLVDFVDKESNKLAENLKNYRELGSKINLLVKKAEKSEIEKLVRQEKENANAFFRAMKAQLDKNQEMTQHVLDKFLRDALKTVDEFKKSAKYFGSDSSRYCGIIEELANFRSASGKQKAKLLNIYNVNQTFTEIKLFNKEVVDKLARVMSPEKFFLGLRTAIKNCLLYKSKTEEFLTLISTKLIRLAEKGFEGSTKFYARRQKRN